uniref:Uncharacterized protein n=1 Tax=Anguilla anguilla TaxID=7936 RepID=A0A0E9V2E6_ANGAN
MYMYFAKGSEKQSHTKYEQHNLQRIPLEGDFILITSD